MKDKRSEKLKKHFDITVNGEKVKILNYILSEQGSVRLITKVRGQNFHKTEETRIVIETEGDPLVIIGRWTHAAVTPTLEDHFYKILTDHEKEVGR